MQFAAPLRALARRVPDAFVNALQHAPAPLDAARARAQHAGYLEALREAGVAVELLEADEAHPDCCFVEDTAVVLSAQLALLTRPGAPSRRGEGPAIHAALEAAGLQVRVLEAPATLDGGDVLRVNDERLLVGLSSRTNAAGADGLAAAARELGLRVTPVPLAAGLHLKSAVTLAAPDLLVAHAGLALPDLLDPIRVEVLEVPEAPGANVLALGERVLVSASAPATLALLRARGLQVRALPLDELHQADGALTCLSLRIPPRDGWCA